MCAQTQENFKHLILGHPKWDEVVFNFSNVEVIPEDSVKLLGVYVDSKLNFDKHVSDICIKSARQINVQIRLSRLLDVKSKLTTSISFFMGSVHCRQHSSHIWNSLPI